MSAEEAKPPVEGEQPPAEGEEAPEEAVEEVVEEVEVVMGIDEFYADDHVEKPPTDSSLSKRTMNFYECLG
jgi:hypothetical protein